MNPWSTRLTEKLTDGVRVTIWSVLAINVFLAACFSVWWVAEFLGHLRGYFLRSIFRDGW
jgi:hypothetical protein